MQNSPPDWEELWGQCVVLDLASHFVSIGHLVRQSGDYLLLKNADLHDLRDTATTTREHYVLEARRHGVNANRAWVWVNTREVVGISRLDDVLLC